MRYSALQRPKENICDRVPQKSQGVRGCGGVIRMLSIPYSEITRFSVAYPTTSPAAKTRQSLRGIDKTSVSFLLVSLLTVTIVTDGVRSYMWGGEPQLHPRGRVVSRTAVCTWCIREGTHGKALTYARCNIPIAASESDRTTKQINSFNAVIRTMREISPHKRF